MSSEQSLRRQAIKIAWPMVLSNITVPLLGLVDTAVIGHLQHAYFLGGVALGSMVLTLSYWLLGFVRMSTTGLTAQAFGAGDSQQQQQVLWRAVAVALFLALSLIMLQQPIWWCVSQLSQGSAEVMTQARLYFEIRIWSAPAALFNLVALGWLLGMQHSKAPMWLLLLNNSINIVLDLWFVVGLNWQVAGAAWASVIADYVAAGFALWLMSRVRPGLWQKPAGWHIKQQLPHLKQLFALNRDIFIRSLLLQACLAYMTFRGTALGDHVVAANAVLLNFMMFVSYGLDGLAYAAEAMAGEAFGAKNKPRLQQVFRVLAQLSMTGALLFAGLFGVFGAVIVEQLTDLTAVREFANQYLGYVIALPLVGWLCYLMDGVMIGLAQARWMRRTMMLAVLGGYFPMVLLLQDLGNHSLWLALLLMLLLRGLGQWLWLRRWLRRDWRA